MPNVRLVRAPYRISLVGGGLDVFGKGSVISFTIDRYCYVLVSERIDQRVVCVYREREEVEDASEVKNALVREALLHLGRSHGIEIHTMSDIPMKGCGLGTSSSMLVALVQALAPNMSRGQVAQTAFHIEREHCQKSCGAQDHYASAYGGFNCISFGRERFSEPGVTVEDLSPYGADLSQFRLWKYGDERDNHSMLAAYKNDERVAEEMMQLVRWTRDRMIHSDKHNPMWQYVLHTCWKLKTQLTDYQWPADLERMLIESCGKLCGGGQSGYIVTWKNKLPLPELVFQPESRGVEILV